jgi:tetratricopeptide (TPR) repeat protein
MATKTEKDLNEEERAHWLKAVAAIELRNFGYAISLLQGILKQQPEFLTGRQLLRRAEVAKQKSAKKKLLHIPSAPMALMKAQREMKRDPRRAVELIEKILQDDPHSKNANHSLKEAAVAAGWLEIGVFALETLLEETPRDTKLLHELGRLYHDLGEIEREVDTYNRITEIDPADGEALRRFKDASARGSMQSGGWAQAQSYRDLIKDKEVAVSLEQQNRMQMTDESLDEQIAEAFARHEAEPQNAEVARRLGALSEGKNDLEMAIAWYRYASGLMQQGDPALIRKISDLGVKRADDEIAELELAVAEHESGAPGLEQKRVALAEAKQRRAQMLIAEARSRVERNPTDLQFRFELGECLLNAGQYREAVPELQRARQNPNARLKAMNALGRCYRELGMYDLAARQLEEASREIFSMDATKKEIIYNLGMVYDQMGDRPKALECMKQIYEADYGYKDVAERVESSYGSGARG